MGIEWKHDAEHTVAASGDEDIAIDRDVNLLNFTLSKVSGGNVTALTIARSLDGGATWGPTRTVTLAAALSSAGDSVDVDLTDEMPSKVRFGFTVSASTVVKIVGKGAWR